MQLTGALAGSQSLTQVPTTLYVDSLGPDNLPLPLVSEMQMVTLASQNHSEDLS